MIERDARYGVSRRRFIETGVASAAVGLTVRPALAQPVRRPNIIFILADDMGFADISCNGRDDYTTPHIDGIAARGVNLRQGYANSAVCSASRLALITGRYQYRLRLGLEEPLAGPTGRTIGLPPEHPTLPSLLRAAGYGTTLIGKWHLGELPSFGPLQSGYDHFFGFRSGGVDYFNHVTPGGTPDLWDQDVRVEQNGYITELIGQHTVEAIESYAREGRPFLISAHFSAPHWPWEGPEDQHEADRISGSNLRAYDAGTQATYGAMVKAMDDQIGGIVASLRRNGLLDDTIIVFTSDNGGERFAKTWPFSGQKSELLEGGLRIPTLISWPRSLPQGVINEQPAMTMDWAPTLLAAAGAQAAAEYPFDGINLLPVLTGATQPIARQLYWRYKANHQRAMREGNFKYLKMGANTFLFNVVEDPLERANLKDRLPDVFSRLRAQWSEWNAGMLPELDETYTEGVLAETQADHIGAAATDKTADLDPM